MENFVMERNEYFKKLEKHKNLAVRLASDEKETEMSRILLFPTNEEELIKANAYLDFAIDLENLCMNALLDKVKKPEQKDNPFIEFLILTIKTVQSGKSGKDLSEEMSKIAASRGYSDPEYMAELMFNAVLIPFLNYEEFMVKPVAVSCGIDLEDELECLKFKAMLEQITATMPKPKIENEAKMFTEFTNYFHKKCTENTLIEEETPAEKIMKRLLEMLQ